MEWFFFWVGLGVAAGFVAKSKGRSFAGWFLLALVILSGCVTMDQRLETWRGHHMDELVTSWGPPAST